MRENFVLVLTTLYVLALALAFVITGTASLAVTLTSLMLLGLLLVGRLWRSSVVVEPLSSNHGNERWSRKELESIASTVKAAAKGYPYSQWKVASILRQALLDKFAGSEAYPTSWIHTKEGTGRILDILGTNSDDLISVLEPVETVSHRPGSFLGQSKHDVEYLSKLDRALSLAEGKR
jgi:hypothetical protein